MIVRNRATLTGVAFFMALALLPAFTTSPYLLRLAGNVGLYVMLTLGLNVVTGYAGILDLGYVAFFGIGGYTYALLNSYQLGVHMPFYVSLPASVLAGLILTAILGLPALRLRGDYLAIVTLAYGQMFRLLVLNLDRPTNLTNGPSGIVGVDAPMGLGIQTFGLAPRMYIMLIVAIAVLIATSRLANSKFGRGWMAMRDDQNAAACMGVNIPKFRLLAFCYGGTIAAAAGACFAMWQGAVFPQNFSMHELITILCMMALGGSGSVWGAVVGAAILVMVPELLRDYSIYRSLIYGVILIAMMRWRPGGVLPRPLPHPGADERRDDPTYRVPQIQGGRLVVRDLSVVFGGVRALDAVSFEVATGEVLGVIGPNGAGKSTLMNAISGFSRAAGGAVTLDGHLLHGLPPHRVAEAGVSRTFQNIRLFHDMTVEENVLVGHHRRVATRFMGVALGFRSVRRAEALARDHVREVLAFMGYGLLDKRYGSVTGLTYGDARRVELARAIISNPKILLLDEPAAGMTTEEIRELTAQIRQLNQSGYTILLVEHHMEIITDVCDKVLVLDHGQELAFGMPEDVLKNEAVVSAYLGTSFGQGTAQPIAPPIDTSTSEPILQLDEVRASYGAEDVLKGLSLRVRRGEIVALVGSNAAGKTTTLNTLLGVLKPSAGTVTFDGLRVDGRDTSDIVTLGIGVVPEGRRVFARLTVFENLELGAYRSPASLGESLDELYDLFPILKERRTQKAGTLSGGEQQMLAIARALVTKPRLICLDEPSMGLAPVMVERVMAAIQTINAGGTSILLIEQNASAAAAIANRLYVLQGGRAAEVSREAILAGGDLSGHLARAYLG